MKPELQKLYKSRHRATIFISTLLVKLPFVRCIILNGSQTSDRIKQSSDIDLLIIAVTGRIFTARALCILIVWLSGRKRSSNADKPHGGRFCLNYFLTTDFLIIPHNRSYKINKYCAENYSKSIFIAGDRKVFDRFIRVNEGWMRKYLKYQNSNLKSTTQISKSIKQKKQFNNLTIKQLGEKILSGKFGQSFENYIKRVQLNRINRDPHTAKYPDLIVVNDKEMRFHPPK